ncbi:MAG: tetratricopeptide repeat protein [Bacteroidota bacterium]
MRSEAKNILLTILFVLTSGLFSFGKPNDNKATLDSANTAYSKGDYSKAITLYESILSKNVEAPEIYFNLGNAYYKSNTLGLAILNYERAKKLDPQDEDITVNLKLANQKIEDKIEVAPQLFLTEWKNGLVDLMDEKSWSIFCIIVVALSLILLGIYFSSHIINLKRLGFFGGATLFILSIFLFFIARHSYKLSTNSSDGIIISPSVTVVGSPNEKGTKLFILHEGTKVNITQEEESWMEIKIANGNVGWVKKQDIIPI